MRNIQETIIALVNANSWNEARRIVAQHSELLRPEADALMQVLAMTQVDERAKRVMEEYRALLVRCREVGVEQAFAERSAPSIPPGLEADVAEAQQLETQRQRNPRALEPLIQIYERILRLQLGDYSAFRAAVQTNLGNAYCDLLAGNREANLMRAMEYYREALRFYKPETAPHAYAVLQNNLGNAYFSLPTGDREKNLAQAIECYLEALRFQTPEATPLDYARTQNNLGNAYRNLPTGDRGVNLAQAIECYLEALRFYRLEVTPREYAMVQNNLGIAYRNLPTGNYGENLSRAIECYREALRFYTPEVAP